MERDILSLIERRSEDFSKSQRLIAGYILENCESAAFMTAGKLGRAIGVSESTVVRFATELGYDGYPEMKRALQNVVRTRIGIRQPGGGSGGRGLLSTCAGMDIERIRSTFDALDSDAFERAADRLMRAENVYVSGSGTAAIPAQLAAYYMNLLRDGVRLVCTGGLASPEEQLFRVSERDVYLCFSFPEYSESEIKCLRYVKNRGAFTVGMTDAESSPICPHCDVKLFAKSDDRSFADSMTAPLSLTGAVVNAMASRSRSEVGRAFTSPDGGKKRHEG